jgi:hypothetical protein
METNFVVCIKNEGYPASLEQLKIYRTLPDERVKGHKLIRIIDESGEDYLYPDDFFVPISVPEAVTKVFELVT